MLLLDGSTSVSLEETEAVEETSLAMVGVTTTVAVAVAPTLSLPRVAVTTPPE
jgi:hypothetical protein